jgi:hypothetical protein
MWIILYRGTTAKRTQWRLFIGPDTSVCIADRMSKVEKRMSNWLSAMAAVVGFGTAGGCCGDWGDGGDDRTLVD